VDTTLDVIAEHGVTATTHRAIARAADVPLGSLTYHFASLTELLAAAFTQHVDTVAERFDERMRAARAVITGEGKLDAHSLQGKLVGEIGTRARQAGVPLHAIVGTDALDPFGKRIIDLQRTLVATTLEELEAAGEALGSELAEGLA
jgi:AcrR family transcriptional regulator